MHFLLTYDIKSNKRRRRVSRILLDYGWRVQLSVFESTEITDPLMEDCLGRIRKELGDGDSFRVYSLCRACSDKVRSLGRDPARVDLPTVIVI